MHFFNKSDLTRKRVEGLIREGVGVRETVWKLPGEQQADAMAALIDPIVEWVREVMGEMRRPYGIDHVALALACRDAQGRILCSNSLGVVRPGLFYEAEGSDRIAAFMDDVSAVPAEKCHEIVGALLSLGDIAYELNVPKAA